MNPVRHNDEVFYATEEIVVVGPSDLKDLQKAAKQTPRHRARLCTHAGQDAPVHEMFIVLDENSYIRPHRHISKAESFTIIEGECEVVLFGDDGSVREIIPLGPAHEGYEFYYRLGGPVFHTVLVRTPWVTFLEVTKGPFLREETIPAPWAPLESDSAGIARFQIELEAKLRTWRQSVDRKNQR